MKPSAHPTVRLARRAALVLPLLCAAFAQPAQAQQPAAYPTHAVRLLVGFPPGTGPDIVARLLAQKLSERWGSQAVVVENKPGAGGLIAATEAARAQPDGYTLMLGETGQLAIAPSSYNRLPYDPKKDFVPVSQVVTSDFLLVASPQKVTARELKTYVEWGRQQKPLLMGTFGAGSPGHFGVVIFGNATGLEVESVHYKTTGDALGGVYSGDVAGIFASVGLAAPLVKSGKLFALASTGSTRNPALPEVPLFRELGYPLVSFQSWYGVVAPAGTPPAVLAKLEADVLEVMKVPETRARIAEIGANATGTTAQEFARILAADTQSWGKVVTATGFKAD